MKLFICNNWKLSYQYRQGAGGHVPEKYVVADQIIAADLFLQPNNDWVIRCTVDNGRHEVVHLGRPPSDGDAERAFRELRALIGKHSTNEPGGATIAFNGTQWLVQ